MTKQDDERVPRLTMTPELRETVARCMEQIGARHVARWEALGWPTIEWMADAANRETVPVVRWKIEPIQGR